MKISSVSKTGPIENRLMYSKSDKVEIMTGFDINEIFQELFKSLLQRYQMSLEQSVKSNNIVFDGVEESFVSVIR